MPYVSKKIGDLVALFLGGTFLVWLVGHLLQPLPVLPVAMAKITPDWVLPVE